VAAVAAVGSPARHVRLATEAQAAVAAGASRDEDPCSVIEHPFIVEEAGTGRARSRALRPSPRRYGVRSLAGGGCEHPVDRPHDRYRLIERQQGALEQAGLEATGDLVGLVA
jgi:hypothetical protein